ncbi:hypothetical protein FWF89_01900 [Candidatus Saccharibacteria bacterium]|nr:hypothetical protein [Candidatus Saccharibacteria bacterium]
MVCIAAFIILCILSVFVAILSIFRRDLGKKYWQTFKKAWGCVAKKVTLQKCETHFKEDIKNSILKKVIIKKPKLVKPISIGIEITAVLIVAITVWSLVTAVKSGLALWTLGTCDVVRPSACVIGAEICSIDQEEPKNPIEAVGRWFADWGEIFSAIPDKFRSWDVENFPLHGFFIGDISEDSVTTAIDILDPGCVVCLQSFKNQLSSSFFNDHKTLIVPFAIENPDGSYKFKNSGLIVRYLLAISDYGVLPPAHDVPLGLFPSATLSVEIIKRIFTTYNDDHIIYQTVFNELLDEAAAEALLQVWLSEFGYSDYQISEITNLAHSEAITDQMTENSQIIQNDIRARGIPTMIFDGRRHTGLFKAE